MSYLGNKPTAVPLTSSDIQDGTITASDIADSTITSGKIASGVIANQSAFKNIIINGDMSIAQRGTSESGVTSSGYKTCDRWFIDNSNMGTFTISQSTDVPTGQGFATSLKYDCTTADASPSAGDVIWLRQKFEGQNLQYLKFATSNAESLTLSFWIKSNKTGTYNVALFGQDSAPTAQYLTKEYTISSANTWEKKTITYAGNTANGFDNDNARSLDLVFSFGNGSTYTGGTLQTVWSDYGTNADLFPTQGVNIADSTSNELFVTGVQLEAGTASDFEFLPYDVNLKRCQRYLYKIHGQSGDQVIIPGATLVMATTNTVYATVPCIVPMRAAPSTSCASGATEIMLQNNVTPTMSSFGQFDNSSVGQNNFYGCNHSVSASSGTPFTAGNNGGTLRTTLNVLTGFTYDAEL